MLEKLLLPLLNRTLAEQAGVRAALRTHAGKVMAFDVGGVPLRFAIDPAGSLLAAAPDQAADVRVEIPAHALPHLMEGPAAVQARARISGDAGLAEVLPRLAEVLRPDLGAWLSPMLGDILANRIEQGVAALAAMGRRGAAGLSANLGEYLKEESGLAVGLAEARQHHAGMERLQGDLNALEQRVARLR